MAGSGRFWFRGQLRAFSDLQHDGGFRPNSCTSARGMPHTAPFTVPPDIDTEIADSSGWHAYSHRYSTVLSVASSCLQLIPAYSAIAVVCSVRECGVLVEPGLRRCTTCLSGMLHTGHNYCTHLTAQHGSGGRLGDRCAWVLRARSFRFIA